MIQHNDLFITISDSVILRINSSTFCGKCPSLPAKIWRFLYELSVSYQNYIIRPLNKQLMTSAHAVHCGISIRPVVRSTNSQREAETVAVAGWFTCRLSAELLHCAKCIIYQIDQT